MDIVFSFTEFENVKLPCVRFFFSNDVYNHLRQSIVYGKRQTAKMNLLPFLFSCVYSGVKLFVFAIKSRRRYSIFVWFIYGLEEKNSKAEVMSSAVKVMLNLSKITSAFEFFSSNP